MKNPFSLLLCVFVYAGSAVAQDVKNAATATVTFDTTAINKNAIYYSAARPVQFADFKGVVPANTAVSALTYCSIGISMRIHTANGKKTAQITLDVYFDPLQSWMLPAQQTNTVLLAHEQLHFDIAAYFACSLKAKLATATFSNEHIQQEIEALYHQAIADLKAEQEKYDAETVHGTVNEAQAKWESNVAGLMAGQHCF